MIKAHCFEKPWIDGFKAQEKYRRLNPPVLEKMINALYLLQLLKKNDCQFVFKGGTSLILILETARRFSVDIDIITRHSKEEIEVCLQKIVETSSFTSWQLDEHRSYKEGVPKAHYELEYPSHINKDASYIQLDILFEDLHYPKIQEISYRGLHIGSGNVLWDVIETSKLIAVGARLKASDQPAKSNYELLLKGIRAFDGFLIEGYFRLDDAILAGAKASYLAASILSGNKGSLEKYAGQSVADLNITHIHWNALNRLKRMPEAYFYWHKALAMLNLINQASAPAETHE